MLIKLNGNNDTVYHTWEIAKSVLRINFIVPIPKTVINQSSYIQKTEIEKQ